MLHDMRRGQVSLEDQVGGLVPPERYELRHVRPRAEADAPTPAPLPARALTIRASRADEHEAASTAA
jgi:hypothetical protein